MCNQISPGPWRQCVLRAISVSPQDIARVLPLGRVFGLFLCISLRVAWAMGSIPRGNAFLELSEVRVAKVSKKEWVKKSDVRAGMCSHVLVLHVCAFLFYIEAGAWLSRKTGCLV
jgi:hypothetical protein